MILRIMLPSQCPDTVNPYQLAQQACQLDGELSLKTMPRLASLVRCEAETAAFTLNFSLDHENACLITGSVTSSIQLNCQRCLIDYNQPLALDLQLVVVTETTELDDLPGQYEPVVVSADKTLSVYQLIEDEIILNIPLIPSHKPNVCSVKTSGIVLTKSEATDTKRHKPFESLGALLNTDTLQEN